ncbi:hypothetical protein NQ317_011622 [Molorchus minor]|uniref:Carboxylic ester hydrolase n=1 Tax=Molorchus minor TaxID=1323400 RepID=A0ABQ9J1N4_9CUCU|nr:hypothetical protein NQ317_011622 [Molorchus minor]
MNCKICCILLFCSISYGIADVLVTLPNGKVRGHVLESPGGMKFYAFQGIPYAKPPVGNLRFQAPQAVENWDGIINATKTSNRCYSVAKDTDDESEDCLYLNVYTPILESENNTKLPVMIFIYGGGFNDGASAYNIYGPDYLLEQDLIVVSFNYRVGPFGFLSTGDEVVPGNAGLKDQLLALKWTNQNIGLFGGDITKITLFGQSAGAASVAYHILSNQSAGLFRAGIAESGSALNIWGFLQNPRPYGFELALKIDNVTVTDNSTLLLNYLLSVPAKEIDIASTKTKITVLPVIEKEGEDSFLTKEMYEQLESGDINRVPLLIGINSEESLGKAKDLTSYHNELVKLDSDITLLIPSDLNLTENSNKTEIAEEIKKDLS